MELTSFVHLFDADHDLGRSNDDEQGSECRFGEGGGCGGDGGGAGEVQVFPLKWMLDNMRSSFLRLLQVMLNSSFMGKGFKGVSCLCEY